MFTQEEIVFLHLKNESLGLIQEEKLFELSAIPQNVHSFHLRSPNFLRMSKHMLA